MADQTSSSPPPIPNANANDWYYVANGAKKGPVSLATIKDLLNKKESETDTQVWRKGMIDWKNIRESELAELVATEPPAVAPQHIGNGYVWTLAFLPLIWGFIDASIDFANQKAMWSSLAGVPYHKTNEFPWQIPFAINGLFGWLDELRLRKAGYGSKWMRAAAVLLVPVYLFVRAKRLKQRPWYAVCWIVTFFLGIFLIASVQPDL